MMKKKVGKWGITLLSLPRVFGDRLMELYHKNNDFGFFAPQVAGVEFFDGSSVNVMVSKRHRVNERYIYYAIAKRYFSNHIKAVEIISLVIDDNKTYMEEIFRNQKELNYQKTNDALNYIGSRFGFKQHKLG